MVAGAGKVGLSANAWFGWDEETVYGTKVGPAGSTEFAYILSESLRGALQIRDVPNISLSHQDAAQTYRGREIVEGDVTMAMVYEGFETLLLHAFGELNNAAGNGSGTFTRDFDLADAGRFRSSDAPSLSLHVSRGVVGSGVTDPTVFTYAGCVVDGFTFRTTADGHVDFILSFFGRQETIATSSQAFAAPSGPIMNGTELAVTWGGTAIPVSGSEISVQRAIDRDRFFHGSTLSEEPPMGKYLNAWSIDTEWDNEERVSTNTMRDDYAAKTQRSLNFEFTSTGLIPATGAQFFQFDLVMAAAEIRTFPPNVQTQGRVPLTITGVGLDADVATAPYELRCTQQTENTFAE